MVGKKHILSNGGEFHGDLLWDRIRSKNHLKEIQGIGEQKRNFSSPTVVTPRAAQTESVETFGCSETTHAPLIPESLKWQGLVHRISNPPKK